MTLDEALAELLGDARHDDPTADCRAAAIEAMRRRRVNSEAGGAAILALHRSGMSWREIGALLGCSHETARQWGEPTP